MPGPSCVWISVAPARSSGTSTTPSTSHDGRGNGVRLTRSYPYVKPRADATFTRRAAPGPSAGRGRSVPAPVDVRAEDAVGDEIAHHLERAAADREHACVAHHALQRQRAAVAGGAVDLQRLAGDLLGRLRRERLGLRRLQRVGEAMAGTGGRAVDHQARGVDLDRHVGELPADALEVADGPAELVARARVGERLFVGALGQAERHGGRAEPLTVVGGHQLLEAVPGPDQQVVSGNLAALEVQLALGNAAQAHHEFAPADAEARRVALDEDAADALGAGAAAEAPVHEIEPRRAGPGDPALVAVDPVTRLRLLDPRLHVGRRGARRRLA